VVPAMLAATTLTMELRGGAEGADMGSPLTVEGWCLARHLTSPAAVSECVGAT
jgi:hypothetical protein